MAKTPASRNATGDPRDDGLSLHVAWDDATGLSKAPVDLTHRVKGRLGRMALR